MQLALMQGIEIGTHTLPFHLGNPLGILFWVAVLLGAGIQTVLNRRGKCRLTRAAWLIFLLAALLACEIACQIVTGWELLLPVMLYFYLLAMLLGALLCLLARRLRQNRAETP